MPHANGNGSTHQGLVPNNGPRLIHLADGTAFEVGQAAGRLAAQAHSRPTLQRVEIVARSLPDGTELELVRDPSREAGLGLLVWKAGNYTVVREFAYQDQIFIPPRLDASIAESLQLPVAPLQQCGAPEEILADLVATFGRYFSLPDDAMLLIAHDVLATWLTEELQFMAYLWICGSFATGKTRLLRLLHCLCRRAIMLSDLTPGTLYALSHQLAPTMLLDEFEEASGTHQLRRFLRAGTALDGNVGRRGRLYKVFCPKVIASRHRLADPALNSRALFITMLPSSRPVEPLDSANLRALAAEWQSRLLRFRLEHRRRVRLMEFSALTALDGRMRDIARSLSVSLLGNPELEAQLVQALVRSNSEASVDNWLDPEHAIFRAAFRESHSPEPKIFVNNITRTVARLLAESGESPNIEPRKVGEVLRKVFGCRTTRIGPGFYLCIDASERRRLHQLARDLGVKRADIVNSQAAAGGYGGAPCSSCEEFGLNVDHDGKLLKSIAPDNPRPGYTGPFEPAAE